MECGLAGSVVNILVVVKTVVVCCAPDVLLEESLSGLVWLSVSLSRDDLEGGREGWRVAGAGGPP